MLMRDVIIHCCFFSDTASYELTFKVKFVVIYVVLFIYVYLLFCFQRFIV